MVERFGCAQCAGAEAGAFWEAWPGFAEVARVVDESHFVVRVAACAGCGQRWVSAFTESIDWQEGDDPQHWLVVPVSEGECAELVAAGEAGVEERVTELARGRRCLHVDYQKGERKTVRWGEGGIVVRGFD